MYGKELDVSHGLLLLILLVGYVQSLNQYNLVCHMGSWGSNRTGEGKFLIENIEPYFCTHLIYAYATLTPDFEIGSSDPHLDLSEYGSLANYRRFNLLREKNPEIKTLLAIGGWDGDSSKYSTMASDENERKKFIVSVVKFLKKHKFNGLDVDWEYPASRGGFPKDKKNFVILLRELKKAMEPHGLMLSISVSASIPIVKRAYNIPKISKYVDMINLMAYDFHGSWRNKTAHSSPLYSINNTDPYNVASAIDYWINKKCPPEKLNLGLAFYGHSFTLSDPNNNGLGAEVNGSGNKGLIIKTKGIMSYNEICKCVKKGGWTVVRNDEIKAPYAFKDDQWVGYDNEESLREKVKFLKEKGLGGAMVWSLEMDDFKGYCNKLRYPLLFEVQKSLKNYNNKRL